MASSVITRLFNGHRPDTCYSLCIVQLLTYRQKYQKIPEVEQLRREIGSYRTKWSTETWKATHLVTMQKENYDCYTYT